MSEDKSADAAGASGAPVTPSLGEAPPTTSVPRQTLGEVPADEPAAPPAAHVDEVTGTAGPGPEQSVGSPATPSESVQVLPVAPPKRRRSALSAAIFGVVVVVLLAAIGFLVYQRVYGDPTKNATAGQCLGNLPDVSPGQDLKADGGKIVDCADSTAVYQIESRLDNQTSEQAKSVEVCKGSPDATVIYRTVPDNGTGYVLCLKKLG